MKKFCRGDEKRAGRITAADSVHKEKHNCLQYMVYEQKSFEGKDGYPHGLPSSGGKKISLINGWFRYAVSVPRAGASSRPC